ncbi:OPT superfamily oligopeptide transporter [Trichodelitschia bisporula]|uniref:OPT superfamily oligopeptide transporter n=1 Tax=Trichodelitschia bisporula TaxID=703511 RepID=A0A6G1I0W4_9PEZI|nr:OPT superfamily oligopeptide transporter [Trichodelitschia bisporula]
MSKDAEEAAGEKRPRLHIDDDGEEHFDAPVETARDLVTEVIHATDDPTLNPWTFRTWFLGIGLSTFGGVLATIYYFKPQQVVVSTVFVAVVSYVLGLGLEWVIPKRGIIGRLLNPHPFNNKEHAAIIVMASAATNAPLAIEVLAVSKLYYNVVPNAGVGIFIIWSSQCLGYGIAGLLRRTLVYPTKMLFPYNLPMNSLLETLHGEKSQVKKKLRVFYIGFLVLFFYEIIPQWIMPVLLGISFFCLAKRDSLVFTNIFGGTNGNEGLGTLQLSFDWQYIANPSPLWYPLQTLFNSFVGYVLCIFVFVGIYYGNIWNSYNLPFLNQGLWTEASNSTYFVPFNQTIILNDNYEVDMAKVMQQGLPYFTGTFAAYILATNLSITATFTHLFLWNYDDIKTAWAFASLANLKHAFNPRAWNWRFWTNTEGVRGGPDDKETDPHYRLMLAYKDAPDWWYMGLLVVSTVLGLTMLYLAKSTLPWWGFFIACLLSSICILFFGAQYAITGYDYNIQPVMQMLGGYLHPGRPMANMYFVLFGYNSVVQGQLLLRDLKFAQYAHLCPRATFVMQLMGTFVGSTFSYIMMSSITTEQRDILLSREGTNVWSGQGVQSFNSQAVMWGGLAKSLFSVGQRYQWITLAFLIGFLLPIPFWLGHKFFPKLRLDYWNTAVIANWIGLLNVGINSVTTAWFVIGAFSQFYLRRYRPNWFIKYNYILSAAMDGGTQVVVFILSFAVQGAAGTAITFPPYWGNNYNNGHLDFCMVNPA